MPPVVYTLYWQMFTGSEFTLLNFPEGALFNRVNRSTPADLNREPPPGRRPYGPEAGVKPTTQTAGKDSSEMLEKIGIKESSQKALGVGLRHIRCNWMSTG
jgi:hypothetical protein